MWSRIWRIAGVSLMNAIIRVGAPPFALEQLDRIDAQRVIERFPRTQRDGTTALTLMPLAWIEDLAAMIPTASSLPWDSGTHLTLAQLSRRTARRDTVFGEPDASAA
jgi:hypothetical protein